MRFLRSFKHSVLLWKIILLKISRRKYLDNGGELYGKEFDYFCINNNTSRQNTTPYMSQQTKVAKRMNKTLIEKPKSVLVLDPDLLDFEMLFQACLDPST